MIHWVLGVISISVLISAVCFFRRNSSFLQAACGIYLWYFDSKENEWSCWNQDAMDHSNCIFVSVRLRYDKFFVCRFLSFFFVFSAAKRGNRSCVFSGRSQVHLPFQSYIERGSHIMKKQKKKLLESGLVNWFIADCVILFRSSFSYIQSLLYQFPLISNENKRIESKKYEKKNNSESTNLIAIGGSLDPGSEEICRVRLGTSPPVIYLVIRSQRYTPRPSSKWSIFQFSIFNFSLRRLSSARYLDATGVVAL